METILVSACLLGKRCRYNGRECLNDRVKEWAKNEIVVGVCPEVESGLMVPRKRCEIIGGDGRDVLDNKAKVLAEDGSDLSLFYLRGARIALEKASGSNVKKALLKDNSPSCGTTHIYDGTFKGLKRQGEGVTAAILKRSGIEVVSDENLQDI